MSQPVMEYPPEKRIALVANRFTPDDLHGLVSSEHLRRYITAIKLSKKMLSLSEFHAADGVKVLCNQYGVDLLADTQLAGGYDDIIDDYVRVMRLYNPHILTVATGTTLDALRDLEAATPEGCKKPKIFMTAVLPEVDRKAFELLHERTPEEYTERCGVIASHKADGVFGAAVYAGVHQWDELGLKYMGAGISIDGQNYSISRVEKVAMRAGEAVTLGCSILLVGNAIAAAQSPSQALSSMGESIEQALAA